MTLKVGDRVKMTKDGFRFYLNPEIQADMSSIRGVIGTESFVGSFCEAQAVQGIGVVKKFNSSGDPFVAWRNSVGSLYFRYSHYFNRCCIRKLTLLERFKLLICSII